MRNPSLSQLLLPSRIEVPWETIIAAMVAVMPEDHRRFLVDFKRREPDWGLLEIPEARHLPADMWK